MILRAIIVIVGLNAGLFGFILLIFGPVYLFMVWHDDRREANLPGC